ncbi:hypothetical protein BT69DRAFT_1342889 [Atractiella rhizophila]|nr:hypothetical protein BT69DRAFT_1342889 [Atractiella rhizophila]
MHSEATDCKGMGINADVLTARRCISFFPANKLLLRVVGPVVDTIGKLERSDCTLADVVLELLRLAKHFDQMDLEQEEDPNIGWENLFIDKASVLLCNNVDKYHDFEAKFAETSLNALKYWEELALPPSQYPLISVAIHIFSMVPHAGVVENYNELDIIGDLIGDLEEAVSADEDLVTHLQLELKKAKEEMAKAIQLGREHLPQPSDPYDLIAYDAMLQNGTKAMTKMNLAKSQQRHGNEERFSRSEGG